MSNFDINNVIPLSKTVKAAAMALGEDYTKSEATLSHFAGRVWTEINNQYIGAKVEKSILPIHKNLQTVTLPLGTKKVLFVGLINECGEKIELENLYNLVGDVKEVIVEDKCTVCHQDKDICEQLVAYPKEEIIVNIDGTDYVNTIEKFFEEGNYFIVKKTWAKNYVDNTVEQVITTEFLSCFDMLPCGCIEPSQANIYKVKETCYDCYCKCYSPCVSNEYVEGGYRIDVDNGNIMFNKGFPYDKIYVEYKTALPRKNGELVIPELAYESMIAGIIYRATEHKKNTPLGVVFRNEKQYTIAKKNMHRIMCRISLNDVFNCIIKIPKFDLSVRPYSCNTSVSNRFTATQITTEATVSFTPPIQQLTGKEVFLFPYTSAGAGEDFIISNGLINKKVISVFKDGQGFMPIAAATPFDTSKKQFKYYPLLGKVEFSIAFYGTEDAFIQYY